LPARASGSGQSYLQVGRVALNQGLLCSCYAEAGIARTRLLLPLSSFSSLSASPRFDPIDTLSAFVVRLYSPYGFAILTGRTQ